MGVTVTTGRTLSADELAKAVEQLEAKAKLAESKGLRHTARSWREQIASLCLCLCVEGEV